MKMHVKTGDTVVVLSGADKKMQDKDGNLTRRVGKVIATSPEEGKVIVEGVNVVSKHKKARKQGDESGIIDAEGAIYASKVALVCTNSKCKNNGKATRVKKVVTYNTDKNGKKTRVVTRVCAVCGSKL